MTKYTQAFKQQVVEYYLQQPQSISNISRVFQTPESGIRRWVRQYEHFGSNGLAVLHITQKYTLQDKLNAIEYVNQHQLTLDQIALELGISNGGVIYQWLQGFNKFGINGLIDKPKGRKAMNKPKKPKKQAKPLTRLERLEQENLYLRAENAILKKLEEFAQRDEAERQKLLKP